MLDHVFQATCEGVVVAVTLPLIVGVVSDVFEAV